MDRDPEHVGTRRGFLKQVASAGSALPFAHGLAGGAAVTSLAAAAAPFPAAAADPVVGYVCFSESEAAFIETMVNIMRPADEFTPNGVDCGLATYIDRQLAGDFGRGAKRYSR